ncbi:required for drug-induced death protein 1-like [Aulostomus maculatus]
MKPTSLSSRWFDRNTASGEGDRAARYRRHEDCVDHPGDADHSDSRGEFDNSGLNEKSHREIHFAFLPERYEPLIDEEVQVRQREEKKRKKEKYKKVKKNVGKALRSTWKCLMLGLYNFALGYSTPITVAATFVPDFHPGRNRT